MTRWLVAILLTAILPAPILLWPGTVQAGSEGGSRPEIVGIRVGFSDQYKAGLWTPVEITLSGVEGIGDGQIRLTVPDSDGVPCRVTAPLPCPDRARQSASDEKGESPPPGTTKALIYTRFGRRSGEATIELCSSDGVLARKVFSASGTAGLDGFGAALFSDQDLIVAVGPDGMGVEDAVYNSSREPSEQAVVAQVTDIAELPDRWYGYESVHTVIVSTSDPAIRSSLESDSQRIEALEEWVQMGGRLIFCAGNSAQEILEPGEQSALARFVPGGLRETRSLSDGRFFRAYGSSLESYCGSLEPLRAPRIVGGKRSKCQVPLLADVKGVVESGDGNMPLVVRRAVGFGQIVFFAGDLDRPPVADWPDRPLLLSKLLDLRHGEAEDGDGGSALVHFGYADLAGQLRSGLDQFAGVWQVPVSLVIGLIVVYLLAIGPGDYFLLRWMRRRMELTWVTFPALVILFCVGAYVLACRSKGDQLRVNQVDIVDIDVESGQLRGTSWANVFSPAMQRYDLTFRPSGSDGTRAGDPEVLVSWLGLPGEGLGGMDPAASPPTAWEGYYELSPELDSLVEVPIPIWSTKSVTARWRTHTDVHPTADLKGTGQIPVGTVTNTLDFPLTNCLLAYGNWAYDLGTLAPGDSARLGPVVLRRELNSLLTGRKQVFDGQDDFGRERVTPYDRESSDVAYVLRAMMFFEAAGGRPYTGLSNSYQAFVDLSGLLKANRAVLIATVADDDREPELRGAELVLSAPGQSPPETQTRHDTIVRFVLPVESE